MPAKCKSISIILVAFTGVVLRSLPYISKCYKCRVGYVYTQGGKVLGRERVNCLPLLPSPISSLLQIKFFFLFSLAEEPAGALINAFPH